MPSKFHFFPLSTFYMVRLCKIGKLKRWKQCSIIFFVEKNTFSILWSCPTIHPGGVMDPICYSSSDYLQCHFRLLVVIYWPFLDLPQIVDQQVDPQSNRRTTIPTFSWSSAVPFHVQLLGEWHVRSVLCLFHLLTVRCYGCIDVSHFYVSSDHILTHFQGGAKMARQF